MDSALRLLIKNASDVGLARFMQELFCALIPKASKNQKSDKVGPVRKIIPKCTVEVGLVRRIRAIYGGQVGMAHLCNRSAIALVLCGFAGFSESVKWGRL